MTNELAIRILTGDVLATAKQTQEAVITAVKALSQPEIARDINVPINDSISRKAAIDAINRICPVDTEYDCTLLDRVDVRYVLSNLPSAQSEQRWIPCSERCLEKTEA